MLSSFPKSTISIINRRGEVLYQNIKTVFADSIFLIEDTTLIFEEGDIIEKTLPNGISERYEILETGYTEGLGSISAHFQVKVKKIIKHKVDNIQGRSPNIIHNTYSGVANLQIQQNTYDSVQVMKTQNNMDYEQLELIVELLDTKRLNEAILAEQEDEFKNIKRSLESAVSEKESEGKIKSLLASLKNFLSTCITSAASTLIIDQINKIL